MTEKPGGKSPEPPDINDAGRLSLDDRGNVTWEWREDEELLADGELGATARLRALDEPTLRIQEPLQDSRGPDAGYDPYESGKLSRKPGRKKRDLKALSAWIAARKKAAENDNPGDT